MYQCDEGYEPYPLDINNVIEKAYQNSLDRAKWEENDEDGNDVCYELIFNAMEEIKLEATGQTVTKVKRMTSGKFQNLF